jgi:hypothetical protein
MMSWIRQKNDLTDEVQYACHGPPGHPDAILWSAEREEHHARGKLLPLGGGPIAGRYHTGQFDWRQAHELARHLQAIAA